jgi:hypothetical protein
MPKWAKTNNFWIGLLTVAGLAAGTLVTIAEGKPNPPHPDYAFDSALVEQIERGVVVFAIFTTVAAVVVLGFRGVLTTWGTSGPRYAEVDNALESIKSKMEDLNKRVDGHDHYLANEIEPLILSVRKRQAKLSERVRALENQESQDG